jgi:succinate-semialdehyde dehydrogenase/glutarate-semialdehyde dehydrogenase
MTVPADAPRLESFSAVTGELLGTVRGTPTRDVERVVAGAAAVQRLWAQLRLRDRARYMQRAAQAVIDESRELEKLICHEQGRPCAEVQLMELLPAIETLQWLADDAPGILSGERVSVSRFTRTLTRARWTYEPLGVIAVIGPVAEPFATPLGDVAVALMAGNGVVLKPSPHAALAGERIGRVFARAGLPEGLLRIVHGHGDVGDALVESRVAQVRFTGAVDAGRRVGEACARGIKRSVLDLGGKDAMVVCTDADVPRAVAGAVWGAFANAGQCGGSVKRAYVVTEVADRFLAGVIAGARALRCGDPRDPRTSIGPLSVRDRLATMRALIDDAVEHGATLHCGGPIEIPGLSGPFFAPAVLTGVTPSMRLAREEAPGPVLAVTAVETEVDAIAGANDTPFGLGASVWSQDRYKAARVARELNVGMVWMNDHVVARSTPQLPWGGVRGSGIGRARGAVALRTCAEPKVLTWDPPHGKPFWYFPYDTTLLKAARALSALRSARDADRERALRQGGLPALRVILRTLASVRRG